jgi:hypothetical protein
MCATFLYGEIVKEVFLGQLLNFVDDEHPTKVCQLVKTLYGLKQSLWVWNHKFNNFLTIHDLIPSIADPCVYVNIIDLLFYSFRICQ